MIVGPSLVFSHSAWTLQQGILGCLNYHGFPRSDDRRAILARVGGLVDEQLMCRCTSGRDHQDVVFRGLNNHLQATASAGRCWLWCPGKEQMMTGAAGHMHVSCWL